MFSIIVVPASCGAAGEQIRLEPGETLEFGRTGGERTAGRRHLTIPHSGVSRTAGEIAATGSFWALTNRSSKQTYVVENPEGAGEHIKVAPGRIGAPVPFEFARLVLPAAGELLSFDVWAPRHDYLDPATDPGTYVSGEPTTLAFPLDRTKRYFLVLAALCEPRLRGEPHAPLPTADQVIDRLRPVWPAAGRAAVQWNIDYLAVKLRLKQPPEAVDGGPRLNGKKESLVSLALRFDLVREDELHVLEAGPATAARPAPRAADGECAR
ncbi:FHA domain-containing protein [Streptomyces libani]|uniref:FHA domain-containing protein n=1 Tax=Streptomyces nigrescens TaxID=1920 RepID=UPI0037F52C54